MSAPVALCRPNRTTVRLRSGSRLTGPVLSRTTAILAARADFPLDRLNDAVLIADAIAAHERAAGDAQLTVSFDPEPEALTLRVGPLQSGGARRLLTAAHLPDAGSVIERLADRVEVRPAAGGREYLVLRIAGSPVEGGHAGRDSAALD